MLRMLLRNGFLTRPAPKQSAGALRSWSCQYFWRSSLPHFLMATSSMAVAASCSTQAKTSFVGTSAGPSAASKLEGAAGSSRSSSSGITTPMRSASPMARAKAATARAAMARSKGEGSASAQGMGGKDMLEKCAVTTTSLGTRCTGGEDTGDMPGDGTISVWVSTSSLRTSLSCGSCPWSSSLPSSWATASAISGSPSSSSSARWAKVSCHTRKEIERQVDDFDTEDQEAKTLTELLLVIRSLPEGRAILLASGLDEGRPLRTQ